MGMVVVMMGMVVKVVETPAKIILNRRTVDHQRKGILQRQTNDDNKQGANQN